MLISCLRGGGGAWSRVDLGCRVGFVEWGFVG